MNRRDRSYKNVRATMNLQVPVYSSEPPVAQGGQFYWNSNNTLMFYSTGTTWTPVCGNSENFNVSGDFVVSGNLTVLGETSLCGNVTVNPDKNPDVDVILCGDVNVNGNLILANAAVMANSSPVAPVERLTISINGNSYRIPLELA
jgi:hypothetical protein